MIDHDEANEIVFNNYKEIIYQKFSHSSLCLNKYILIY